MKFLKLSLVVLPLLLSGCSAAVHLSPAEQANSVTCANLQVRLPDTVDGFDLRSTDAQSTAAWGEPASVLYRCGLPEVTVSELKCVTTSGVDWLVDDSAAPSYRFITFGRNPASEVIVDSNKAVGVNVLDQLASTIKFQPAIANCS
ncbi:unannotated protein [freshwater metagenome]|uniref:Unannotated protein n=1 Tax=freshwater metagenome TaxID=449393 RepID=A0A6J7G4K4_9ZZZZ|nr:DUF3515 family protein [Actinomycetota bacterium]